MGINKNCYLGHFEVLSTLLKELVYLIKMVVLCSNASRVHFRTTPPLNKQIKQIQRFTEIKTQLTVAIE